MPNGWDTLTLQRIGLFAATLLYGLQHSVLAARRLKATIARRWGPRGLQVYRLFYNAWAALSLLPVLALAARLPDRLLYRLPWPWWVLALAVQALGAYLVVDGLYRVGIAGFLGLRPERAHLTCAGVYAWVRHPLYVGGLLILWATPVLTVNSAVLAAGWTVYLLLGAWWEERKLTAELGPAYEAYRRAVPMWIPRRPRRPLPCDTTREPPAAS